jgi:hypothetical protein
MSGKRPPGLTGQRALQYLIISVLVNVFLLVLVYIRGSSPTTKLDHSIGHSHDNIDASLITQQHESPSLEQPTELDDLRKLVVRLRNRLRKFTGGHIELDRTKESQPSTDVEETQLSHHHETSTSNTDLVSSKVGADSEIFNRLFRPSDLSPIPGCKAPLDVTWNSISIITGMTNAMSSSKEIDKSRHLHCRAWKTLTEAGGKLVLVGDHETRGISRPYTDHIEKFQALDGFFDSQILKTQSLLQPSSSSSDSLTPYGFEEDTMVLFIDAFDIVFLQNVETLVQCLRKVWCENGWDRSTVFWLGERGLWPPSWQYDEKSYPSDLYDDYKFINTGLYAAHWSTVKELMKFSLERSASTKDNTNDQGIINDIYTNFPAWRSRFKLDAKQQCFASAHMSQEPGNEQYELVAGNWHHRGRDTYPSAIHFNGGKHFLEAMLDSRESTRKTFKTLGDPEVLIYGNDEASSILVKMADMCVGAKGE